MITNKYDPLGRVIETAHWSKQDPTDPWKGGGVELTCTQTEYDAFGNVLKQYHYDREDTANASPPKIAKAVNPGGILPAYDASDTNAIVTFTFNWYDNAKRLKATANFGTNGDHGFDKGTAPEYDPTKPPTWDGNIYSIDILPVDGVALITRYGYDAAGRRIWTQDPNGVVARTWYDY